LADKANFSPGESIQVHFRAPASWPGECLDRDYTLQYCPWQRTTNDNYDVDYQYNKETHQRHHDFKSPGIGRWDMRMHDTDNGGKEITYVSFTVGQIVLSGTGKLWLNKTVFARRNDRSEV